LRNDHGRPPLFERLMEGLEAMEKHAKGERSLRVTEVEVPEPAPRYSPSEVQRIRRKTGLSQAALARFLSVSPKTLQSWEQGVRRPSGSAARLLQVIDRPEVLPAAKSG